MPRVPTWAREFRKERQEYAVVLSGGRWRPATYMGKAWFSKRTEMRYRLGTDYVAAERWCAAANEERVKSQNRVLQFRKSGPVSQVADPIRTSSMRSRQGRRGIAR